MDTHGGFVIEIHKNHKKRENEKWMEIYGNTDGGYVSISKYGGLGMRRLLKRDYSENPEIFRDALEEIWAKVNKAV
jgi:hypothetical protein